MAASDYDYVATRNEIIAGAFRIVGVLEPDQQLSADELAQGVNALQLLVKSWANKNIFLWEFEIDEFTTTIGTETYSAAINSAIIGVEKAWVNQDSRDTPLEVISWSRYLDIEDKESTGRPTTIAFKPTGTLPSVYLYPVPDQAYDMKMLCVFSLKDFDDADETGTIKVRFLRALKYGLADDLYDEYPGAMNSREWIRTKAETFFREAKGASVPSETINEVGGFFPNRRN